MQTILKKTLKDTMYDGNIPVLIYEIHYPFFTSTCSVASARTINEHYTSASKNTEAYARTVLYPQAVESARALQSSQQIFNSYTLDVHYKITYNVGCITSLYTDTYTYMGGAHGETKRTSDTWDFKTGTQLHLNDIYPFTPVSLFKLQKSIEHQISDRLRKAPSSYFEDYSSLLQEFFYPDSFYLVPGNLVIYYQQYDIAPYATGLPEFYFPIGFI